MSSSLENQEITRALAQKHPGKVRAFYGIHPWFIHPISLNADTLPSKREHYTALFLSATGPTDSSSSTSTEKAGTAASDLEALLPSLPEPVLLSTVLASLEARLLEDPNALVGEIGLDKAFHVPYPTVAKAEAHQLGSATSSGSWPATGAAHSSPPEPTRPSPPPPPPPAAPRNSSLQTPIQHQVALVEAQLALAVRLDRHVSFHSVRAAQETVHLLQRFKERGRSRRRLPAGGNGSTDADSGSGGGGGGGGGGGRGGGVGGIVDGDRPGFGRIHICLHSFGGSPETAIQLQKAHRSTLFFSFATAISGRSPRFYDLVRAVDPRRVLVESDASDARAVGGAEQVWRAAQAIEEAQRQHSGKQHGHQQGTFAGDRGWDDDDEGELSRRQRLDACVRTLEENWESFVKLEPVEPEGGPSAEELNRKQRKLVKQQQRKEGLVVVGAGAGAGEFTSTNAGRDDDVQ